LANWPNLAILPNELAEAKERNLLNELIFPVFSSLASLLLKGN